MTIQPRRILGAKFDTGKLVMTPGVLKLIRGPREWTPQAILTRHVRGDWGNLCDEDKHSNDLAVTQKLQIVSNYITPVGEIMIITEWDRSATTILLPEEY